MRLKDALPKMPKIGTTHYLTFIVFLGILNASIGLAYVEAKTSEITVLDIDGAPDKIVFIADPHLKQGNINYVNTIINEINALATAVGRIGGHFVYGNG